MSPLALYVLSLLLVSFPLGRSALSLEPLPQCGQDPKTLACEVAPVCPRTMTECPPVGSEAALECACTIPRWLEGAGWVRTETRDAGVKRYELVSQALADAAEHMGAGWPEGSIDLARAMISTGGLSMGFKERIQIGAKRGPAGELCFMDLMPSTLVKVLPYEHHRARGEELAALVTGTDYTPIRRCFDAGALLLVRTRRLAERQCKGHPVEYSTFALYATGGSCVTLGTKERPDHLATPRFEMIRRFRARKHTIFPDWYTPPKGQS